MEQIEPTTDLAEPQPDAPSLSVVPIVPMPKSYIARWLLYLDELDQAARQYLAWQSIERDKETLNLDAFQAIQASTQAIQIPAF